MFEPGFTKPGEPVLFTTRSACAVNVVVVAAELFPGAVSVALLETDAVLLRTAPLATPEPALATSVMIAEAPDARDGNSTLMLLPAGKQPPPPVALQDTKLTCVGRTSVTATLAAA